MGSWPAPASYNLPHHALNSSQGLLSHTDCLVPHPIPLPPVTLMPPHTIVLPGPKVPHRHPRAIALSSAFSHTPTTLVFPRPPVIIHGRLHANRPAVSSHLPPGTLVFPWPLIRHGPPHTSALPLASSHTKASSDHSPSPVSSDTLTARASALPGSRVTHGPRVLVFPRVFHSHAD